MRLATVRFKQSGNAVNLSCLVKFHKVSGAFVINPETRDCAGFHYPTKSWRLVEDQTLTASYKMENANG